MDQAEDEIQRASKTAGTNVRLSGDEVIDALKAEGKVLSGKLGAETQKKALKKIIEEAEKKYTKGITLNQALKIMRQANVKFGKSVVETQKGAVAASAQKLEANTLRRVVKEMFPEVADALRTQEEILVLQPILNQARAKGNVGGFNLSKFNLTRPGEILDILAGNIDKAGASVAAKIPRFEVPPGSDFIKELAKRFPQLIGSKLGADMAREYEEGEKSALQATGVTAPSFEGGAEAIQQAQPQQPILSPQGQWRWDAEANDWIPNQQADPNMPTKQSFQKAIIVDLQKTGGKNVTKIRDAYEFIYGEDDGAKTVNDRATSLQVGINVIDQALKGKLGFGPVTGRAYQAGLSVAGGVGVPESAIQLNTQYNLLRQTVVRAFQGARMSDIDIQLSLQYTPQITDTPETAKAKLNVLKLILQETNNYLEGVDETTLAPDETLPPFLDQSVLPSF